jgi:phage terminase large subunit-like protein
VPARWRKLFRLLPGYDPIATAAPGQWFDDQAAQLAVDFFPELLTHVEGDLAGKPFVLEPWQQAIIGCIFGWKRHDERGREVRRYREVFIYIPRKNGKTPFAAGILNLVLFTDREIGAQMYSAAADREQAAYLFRQAKGMVENEPALASRCKIYGGVGQRSIVYEAEGSAYKVISSDANTKHGGNSHLVIVDELHAQENRDLVDVLQTSMASQNRKQPLLIFITTADIDRPSICNEKLAYAQRVANGTFPDWAFLPVIYASPSGADWTSPKAWAAANPNLGVSVSREYLERECKRAQESPEYENTFKRLHLNMRTQQAKRWLQLERWDACATRVDPLELEGQPCHAGLDLSTTTDVTALVMLFDLRGLKIALPKFWIPAERAEKRERRDKVPYLTWARQGLLTLTEGDVIDYDVVRADINELGGRYKFQSLGIDRWNATQITSQLTGDGFNVMGFGQGMKEMSPPSKELERLMLAGELAHGGNPVLRWMAGNIALEQDSAGNIKPCKKRSTERIDGIVALIMAIGMATSGVDGYSQVYRGDGDGLLVL